MFGQRFESAQLHKKRQPFRLPFLFRITQEVICAAPFTVCARINNHRQNEEHIIKLINESNNRNMATTETVKVFVDNNEIPWEEVGKGVRRKIMAYDDKLMLVRVEFETGGIGTLHQHYHSQITHVESGMFEVEIAGERQVLKASDVFYIPSNVLHGVICLEAGVLIDVFSPMREDFIKAK